MNITQVTETAFIPDGSGRIITVFLTPLKLHEKRNFRCTNCGNIIFQYQSEVGILIDSSTAPQDSNPILIKCRRCKLMYRVIW